MNEESIKFKAEYVIKTLDSISSNSDDMNMVKTALNYIQDPSVTTYLEENGEPLVRTFGGRLSGRLHQHQS